MFTHTIHDFGAFQIYTLKNRSGTGDPASIFTKCSRSAKRAPAWSLKLVPCSYTKMVLLPHQVWLCGHQKSFERNRWRLRILNFTSARPKKYCEFAFVFAARREILKFKMLESKTNIIIINKITSCKRKSWFCTSSLVKY